MFMSLLFHQTNFKKLTRTSLFVIYGILSIIMVGQLYLITKQPTKQRISKKYYQQYLLNDGIRGAPEDDEIIISIFPDKSDASPHHRNRIHAKESQNHQLPFGRIDREGKRIDKNIVYEGNYDKPYIPKHRKHKDIVYFVEDSDKRYDRFNDQTYYEREDGVNVDQYGDVNDETNYLAAMSPASKRRDFRRHNKNERLVKIKFSTNLQTRRTNDEQLVNYVTFDDFPQEKTITKMTAKEFKKTYHSRFQRAELPSNDDLGVSGNLQIDSDFSDRNGHFIDVDQGYQNIIKDNGKADIKDPKKLKESEFEDHQKKYEATSPKTLHDNRNGIAMQNKLKDSDLEKKYDNVSSKTSIGNGIVSSDQSKYYREASILKKPSQHFFVQDRIKESDSGTLNQKNYSKINKIRKISWHHDIYKTFSGYASSNSASHISETVSNNNNFNSTHQASEPVSNYTSFHSASDGFENICSQDTIPQSETFDENTEDGKSDFKTTRANVGESSHDETSENSSNKIDRPLTAGQELMKQASLRAKKNWKKMLERIKANISEESLDTRLRREQGLNNVFIDSKPTASNDREKSKKSSPFSRKNSVLVKEQLIKPKEVLPLGQANWNFLFKRIQSAKWKKKEKDDWLKWMQEKREEIPTDLKPIPAEPVSVNRENTNLTPELKRTIMDSLESKDEYSLTRRTNDSDSDFDGSTRNRNKNRRKTKPRKEKYGSGHSHNKEHTFDKNCKCGCCRGNAETCGEIKERIRKRTVFMTQSYANDEHDSEKEVNLDRVVNDSTDFFISRSIEHNPDGNVSMKSGKYIQFFCQDCQQWESRKCHKEMN